MESTITESVAAQIALATDAPDLAAECAAEERALNECATMADWEACFDAFGERTVGRYIADEADEFATDDNGSGCAYVKIGADESAYVEWNNAGFYYVTFGPLADAIAAVQAANDEYSEADAERECFDESEDERDESESSL